MTTEEKQLLLKDLCARLPYGVICFAPDYEYGDIGKLWCIEPFEDLDPQITVQYPKGNTITKFCSEVKPYLRPMSSMTEEEIKTYRALQDVACSYHYEFGDIVDDFLYFDNDGSLDYLISIHVDYRDLIPRGLALEAPEDMYKEE